MNNDAFNDVLSFMHVLLLSKIYPLQEALLLLLAVTQC